jgi:hypothetical protein
MSRIRKPGNRLQRLGRQIAGSGGESSLGSGRKSLCARLACLRFCAMTVRWTCSGVNKQFEFDTANPQTIGGGSIVIHTAK